jgi:energy-coupling factor transporter ATP-binding protein EcfA2
MVATVNQPLSDEDYVKQFYRRVAPAAGHEERQMQFYVPVDDPEVRGQDTKAIMLQAIDWTIGGQSQRLFCGPRGSGKSSELIKLGELVKASQPDRVFLRVDIEQFIKPNEPVEAATLLPMIVAGFLSVAEVEPSKSVWQKFRQFFQSIHGRFDIKLGPAEISTDLRSWFTDDPSFRQAVHDYVLNNRQTFRQELQGLVREVAQFLTPVGGQAPILVIDSVDHIRGIGDNPEARNSYRQVRNSVERLFTDYQEELALPGLHVIYCAHEYVQPLIGWQSHGLFNVRVSEADGSDCSAGIATLRTILRRRAPGEDASRLFGKDDLEGRVILSSGGFFRDLFRLTFNLCLTSGGQLPVTAAAVDRAERETKRQLIGGVLTKERADILRAVAQHIGDNPSPYQPAQVQEADFDYLRDIGAVLHYSNGDDHFVVHPLLKTEL